MNILPWKTNMASWKITALKEEIHLQTVVFSIVMLVFRGVGGHHFSFLTF